LVSKTLYNKIIKEELVKIEDYVGKERFHSGQFELATKLFSTMIFNEKLDDFLTLEAYNFIK
jgi:malate synthase